MPRDLLPKVRAALEGRYAIEAEIGRGGAARVYLARAPDGGKVALKILRPELLVSVTAERFLREIQFVSRLDHPNICRLIDSGQQDWLVYYVMPFIEGPSLKQYLQRFRTMEGETLEQLAHDLLDALQHAHTRDIVHRDVKPENVILTSSGPILLDFGIARAIAVSGSSRITRTGIAVGTSTYMSPEQISGEQDIDHRSDLYSLGCVLFESASGRAPFADPNEGLVLHQHLTRMPPNLQALAPALPARFCDGIQRSLAKQREARWGSAAEMMAGMGLSA